MSIPNQSINPIYTVVTPIQYSNRPGHATGFFFSTGEIDDSGSEDSLDREETYLVTNRHVVADGDGNAIDDTIRILTRPSRSDVSKIEHHDIPLNSDGGSNWIEHPDGPEIDIVAIPLDIDVDFDDSGTHYLSPVNFKPEDIELKPGQEALVIGYPIRGKSPYLPVGRNALIASPYGAPFQGLPCFAIDADMHSGTSGSPVITRPSPVQHTADGPVIGGRQQMHFIGVHSATVQSHHDPAEGPLNLNTEWYAELLTDILD